MEALGIWINYNFVTFCTVSMLFVFLIQNKTTERSVKIKFSVLCILLMLETVSATVEELVQYSEQYSEPVRMAMSSVGYFVRPAMFYVILLIMLREYKLKVRLLMGIPLAIEGILLLINLPTKFMYHIVYETGSSAWGPTSNFHYYLYMVLFIYMAIIAVVAVTNYKKTRTESVVVFIALGIIIINYILETQVDVEVWVREIATCMAIIIYFYYFSSQRHVDEMQEAEHQHEKEEHEATERILKQILETLSSTIDAKDRYTQGHSARVAEYSLTIARKSGFSEEECKQVYYAGLLHDIGKIAIPEYIINKAGKLTEEEYAIMKTHPSRGKETLEKLKDMPFLALGAEYHHERYDGKGYPKGLSGKEIPAVGRVIAVADAYDAMTSKRSYRSPLPQAQVREQILRGKGTFFDPKYAQIMLDMIEADKSYEMREHISDEDEGDKSIHCESWWSKRTEGIRIVNYPLTVRFTTKTDANAKGNTCVPSLILYDSDDTNTGVSETEGGKNDFREYAVIRADSTVRKADAQAIETESTAEEFTEFDWRRWSLEHRSGTEVTVTAVRYENMLSITMESVGLKIKSRIALNDSYSWSYLAIAGEYCTIGQPEFYYGEDAVKEGDIPRVGEKPIMTRDQAGDVPNLECDGWSCNRTDGILLTEKPVKITYHTQTYPKAKRIWHSSFMRLFYSDNGMIKGPGYIKYYTLHSDGEGRYENLAASPKIDVDRSSEFGGWDKWLEKNKVGLDCSMTASRSDNKVVFKCENGGVSVTGYVLLQEADDRPVYLALCGELCSITNIHIVK